MTDDDPFSDTEQREFIESLPLRLPYSEIEVRCREKFGERAWPAAKIADFWNRHHPPRFGILSKLYGDKKMREFIEDRLGRFTIREIHAACLERFGPGRSPSRSTIGLHWQRVRTTRGWRGTVLRSRRSKRRR
jgi:hypothetical protein